MKTLIIVESPHKAKTVAALVRPLVKGSVQVWACLGHLRDLPPQELGVNVEGEFEPDYIIPKDREKTVAALRKKIAQADVILLAADPDREGEAVAWHVLRVFEHELRSKPVQRVVFNAITAKAIGEAIRQPRALDMQLVQAAIARRALDRLVGYFVSPVLWGSLKGHKDLSAGRVQTAALRLLIEHEQGQTPGEHAVTWKVVVEI